jgi:hypothetical protein
LGPVCASVFFLKLRKFQCRIWLNCQYIQVNWCLLLTAAFVDSWTNCCDLFMHMFTSLVNFKFRIVWTIEEL